MPVGSFALAAIQRWLPIRRKLAASSELALFIGRNGARLTPRAVQVRIAEWAQKQGLLVHVHPHLFRHSCATHLLESSGALREVSEFLGHANLSTTQIYTHLDFTTLARAYNKAHPRAGRSSTP